MRLQLTMTEDRNNDILLRQTDNGVAYLTLNNPDRLNALSEQMIEKLQASLSLVSKDRSVRCVVIRARGRAFCAGHDLKQLTVARRTNDNGAGYFRHVFDRCSRMMQTIKSMPQPVIAQVQGTAVAAGCQLVATADMAVATTTARFGVNGVNIGLFCSTPMVALTRNISHKHAFEMLTTGRLISAERACEIGLVNEVVAEDAVEGHVRELAELVASKLSAAVKVGKRAFYEQAEMTLAGAYEYAGDVMVENMLYDETAEGISAFLEKRTPRWRN